MGFGFGLGRMAKKKRKKADPNAPLPSSLFIFTESTKIRHITRFIIEWPPFEYAVLLTILANCVVLAQEEHLPEKDRTLLSLQLVRML